MSGPENIREGQLQLGKDKGQIKNEPLENDDRPKKGRFKNVEPYWEKPGYTPDHGMYDEHDDAMGGDG